MSLDSEECFLDKCNFSITIECLLFSDVNVGGKNHNFNIPLILDKYSSMIVMQKLKLMLDFTSAINVKCLHTCLQAKILMHNCARAKYA